MPTTYQFGLLQMLPPIFWFGFAFCLVSLIWGIRRDAEGAFIIKSALLYLLIWNIPVLLLKNPYSISWDGYDHIWEAMPIVLSGHVPLVSETMHWMLRYYPASFPGFHILLSSIFQITTIGATPLVKFYPIFISAAAFAAILLFFRTFVPSVNYRWALLIFAAGSVYMEFHLSPHSAGFVAGTLVLVALEKPGLRWKLTAIFLFAFVVICHPPTTFMLLTIAGLALILRIALHRDRGALRNLGILLITGFVGLGIIWMTGHIDIIQKMIFGQKPALDTILTQAASWHYFASVISYVVIAIYGIVSAYYLATQWLSRAGRQDRRLPVYTAPIVAPVLLVMFDTITWGTGTEALRYRYLLFFFLAAPVFIIKFAERLKGKSTLLAKVKWPRVFVARAFLPLLLLLSLLGLATMFHASSLSILSDEAIVASDFVNDRCDSSQVIGGGLIPDLDHPYQSATLRQISFYRLYPWPLTGQKLPSVVVLDDHDRIWYQVWYGIEKYDFYADAVKLGADLDRVYFNRRYNIYWFPGSGKL
jgi:hypothetical protein